MRSQLAMGKPPMTKFALLLAILFAALSAAPIHAADMAPEVRKSIVYLTVQGISSAGEIEDAKIASGFMISKEGHFITALHVLQDKDGKVYPRYKQIVAKVGGGRNTSREIPVDVLETAASSDLALLKLDETEYTYQAVAFCSQTPDAGQSLLAFGFPGGEGLTPRDGKFSNRGGRYWQVGIDFSWGMSGGPVYDDGGAVRGVVKGGRRDASEVRWIVPIRDADAWLRRFRVDERCEKSGGKPKEPENKTPPLQQFVIDKPFINLNRMVASPNPGMPPMPGFEVSVKATATGAKGKNLQLMVLFSVPGAFNYFVANAAEPFYRNPQGLAATATPLKLVQEDSDTTQATLPFPVYALNLVPTGYRTYYPIIVHVLAFVDNALVAQAASDQFVVAW